MFFPRLSSVLIPPGALVAFAALAPACSSNAPAVAQAGVVGIVQPGAVAGTCNVAGEDKFVIGQGDPDDNTVATGGSWNGAPVNVTCTVSGSDSSGYNVVAQAQYGQGVDQLGFLLVTGHFDGTSNAQTGISGTFYSQQLSKTLAEAKTSSDPGCTVTFPNTGMGIAPGRVWAHIDCPNAINGNAGANCDANANFRFENCGQ